MADMAGPRWTLAATALGTRSVVLLAHAGARRWSTSVPIPDARSAHEAYLLGLVAGLEALASEGAGEVRVVVTDPLLEGLLSRGWSARSVRVIRALQNLLRAARGRGVSVELLTFKSNQLT